MKSKKETIDRIRDRYSILGKMSVCIIGKHNSRGEIDHYVIQKKKQGRRNSRQTVKIKDQWGDYVNLKFYTKDDALERLDKNDIETMFVSDDIDIICL